MIRLLVKLQKPRLLKLDRRLRLKIRQLLESCSKLLMLQQIPRHL